MLCNPKENTSRWKTLKGVRLQEFVIIFAGKGEEMGFPLVCAFTHNKKRCGRKYKLMLL